MIKFLTEILETVKWIFGHQASPLMSLMLPGNRALEVAEQKQLTRQDRDIARMFAGLPTPDKEGQRITLVGQGFIKDVVARQGNWHSDE